MKKLIRFLDLAVSNPQEREELLEALGSHLTSGRFIIQDYPSELEEKLTEFLGRRFCVPVNSGTDALVIGLRLLDLKPRSLILTTPLSWIASSTSILLAGFFPHFVDVSEDMQIDLDLVEQELEIKGSNISALLVPHLHGNCSDLSRLERIRSKFKIKIIEDCAQAFGSRDNSNRLAGSIGDVSAFSFNPMKVLGALGDAGAVFFDDEQMFRRALTLRHSGLISGTKYVTEISTNCRMDALQASFLLVRLRYISEKIERRRFIAEKYNEGLRDFLTPVTQNITNSNHYCYQTVSPSRDQLDKLLNERGVESRIRHQLLIPEHPALNGGGDRERLKRAFRLNSRSLCLPIHENLSQEDVEFVIDNVKDACGIIHER